jgi:hypothetical protein
VARLAFLAQGDHAALDAAIKACLARTERTLYTRWRAISFLVRVRYEDQPPADQLATSRAAAAELRTPAASAIAGLNWTLASPRVAFAYLVARMLTTLVGTATAGSWRFHNRIGGVVGCWGWLVCSHR